MESSHQSNPEASETGRPAPRRVSEAMQRVASQVGEVHSEDARLVSQAQEGRREAFGRLFEKYRQTAYQIAYRLLGNNEDALDAVQEAFTKAFAGLQAFRGGASFKTWFYRIVTNCSLDLRRSRAVRKATTLDSDEPPQIPSTSSDDREPSRPAELKELKQKIDEALAQIPETNRTAFVLFAVEGVSYREIAEILNISIGTVMSRIYYARQKLQQILSESQGGPTADSEDH
ncbi:MAG: RNA polymerase sigma factor [Planctomycetes bacterium]|nr:RNA polymerase sigma factor [Planctomycetota bacterium]